MPNIDYTYQGTTYTNMYTFMYWQSITDTSSNQYRLKIESGMNFDTEGFGKIDGRYVIACTDPADNGGMFGTVGDYVNWVLADGSTLKTVVGDTKSSSDANWIPLGHVEGSSVSVIEFVVNRNNWGKDNPGTSSNHPEWAGQLQSWEKVGNYWGNRPGEDVSFYGSLTSNQKLVTMNVAGAWGGKHLWDYENHGDTGKQWNIGFMAWGGDSLYRFLNEMQGNEFGKPLYEKLSPKWQALSQDRENKFFSAWPNNKGLFTEGLAKNWVDAVAETVEDATRYQEWFWCVRETNYIEDGLIGCLRYIDYNLKNAGSALPDSPTLDQIKQAFYLVCVARCYRNTQLFEDISSKIATGNYDLQRTHNAVCIWLDRVSQSDYASYYISYLSDVYRALAKWDGEKIPESMGFLAGFGENGNGSSAGSGYGSGSDSVTSWSSNVKYIDFYGNQLILHGKDGSKLQFHKTNADVWYPVKGNGTTSSGEANTGNNKPYDPGTGSGNPDYTQIPVFDALKKIYLDNEGKYGYSVGAEDPPLDYKDPRVDGVTNCSAFITWVATQIAPGSDMARSGYYTGTMANMGEKVASGSGGQFPYNLAKPGDLLLLNHNGYNPDYDHVELFMGTASQGNDTGSELWGAGSAPCPHRNYGANALINNGYWSDWQVRRISWGD